MKHVDKKLIGITAVGLSAWILVIGLVIINKSTTTAMLTSSPALVQQTAPQTLGITTLAHGGEHHAPVATPTAANTSAPSVLPVILIVGSVLVAASAVVAAFAIRKRSAKT